MVLSIEHDQDNIAVLSWNWKKRRIDLFLLGGPAHVDGWLCCVLMIEALTLNIEALTLNIMCCTLVLLFMCVFYSLLKKNAMCCTFISFNA